MFKSRVHTKESFKKLVRIKDSGCWHFTGPISATGYGKIGYRGRVTLAHRLSYILHVGDPGELFVLHKCDNRKCVNPEHLFLGTAKDNTQDMLAKNRRPSVYKKKLKIICKTLGNTKSNTDI